MALNIYSKKTYKVIVLGNSGVGKTSLTYRLCAARFLEKACVTIGIQFWSYKVTIDEEEIQLDICDTAGGENYMGALPPNFFRETDAVVFVYDRTCASSFDGLNRWIDDCNVYCGSDILRILIGNKSDEEANVSTVEAQRFAYLNNMPHFEASARLDSEANNVEAIFRTLAHKLKDREPHRFRIANTVNLNRAASPPKDKKGCC